jgi:hypothetical protein
MKDIELWKPAFGYDGVYEVSDMGRVRRVLKGQGATVGIKNQKTQKHNMKVSMCRNGVCKWHYVHHVVLNSFAGERPAGTECCHNDGNFRNNKLSNLRWDTRRSNVLDAIRHGTFVRKKGEDSLKAKLKNTDVFKIRELLKLGVSHRKIASIYGVAHSAIGAIKRNQTWGHLK